MDSFEDMVQVASRLAALQPDTFMLQRRTETESSFVGFESPRQFFHYVEQVRARACGCVGARLRACLYKCACVRSCARVW